MASNRSKTERFLLPALLVALLASCTSAPKAPSRIAPSALLGDCDAYVRFDLGRVEGLVLDTAEGIFGDAAVEDIKRSGAYLNEVYAGLNVSGASRKPAAHTATTVVLTGSFTRMHYSFIFTPKNGWEKATVQGKSRSYPVHHPVSPGGRAQKGLPFLVYAELSGVLLISTDMSAVLDRLFDEAYSLEISLPLWLSDPLPQKNSDSRDLPPFQIYVPHLAPMAGNPVLQSLLSGGLLSRASIEVAADPLRQDGAWALNATVDLDVKNSSLQNAAATVLGVLLIPSGSTVRRGEGSHLFIDNFIVPQEKIQETLVNVLKKR